MQVFAYAMSATLSSSAEKNIISNGTIKQIIQPYINCKVIIIIIISSSSSKKKGGRS